MQRAASVVHWSDSILSFRSPFTTLQREADMTETGSPVVGKHDRTHCSADGDLIDHAGYFIQMALASLPKRLEGVINQKYPQWREVERNPDGSARYMPAGVRLVEASLLREFSPEDMICCYAEDLPKFIGPRTRVIGVLHAQPSGRDVSRRAAVRIHFWILEKSQSILITRGCFSKPSSRAHTATLSR